MLALVEVVSLGATPGTCGAGASRVVEDEPAMANVLRRGLVEEGFAVDGAEGWWYVSEHPYDAPVLHARAIAPRRIRAADRPAHRRALGTRAGLDRADAVEDRRVTNRKRGRERRPGPETDTGEQPVNSHAAD